MSRNFIKRTLIEITSTSQQEAYEIFKKLNRNNIFENKGYIHAGATMKVSTFSEDTESRLKPIEGIRIEKDGERTILIIPSRMNYE